MAFSLLQHGAIRTTEAKAKQLRRIVEKLITTAKKNTLHARRRVIATLTNRRMFDNEGEPQEQTVIQKLFDEIAPRYADRAGGYTRIIHLAERRIGDAGRQVILQLVEAEGAEEGKTSSAGSRRKARAAKRHQAAEATAATAVADQAVDEVADEPVEEAAADEAVEQAVADEPAEEAAEAEGEDEDKKD
jgi:large subunit ribosomal protein L17